MKPTGTIRVGLAAAVIAAGLAIAPQRPDTPTAAGATPAGSGTPMTYAADLVSTRALGVAMNARGDVVGEADTAPPCTGCPPGSETVVWRRGGARFVLPPLPGRPTIEVRGINDSRWVAGAASDSGVRVRAVAWRPIKGGYRAIDLGVLPGTTTSFAAGIDDTERVVGYSTVETFPPTGAPFMWTEETGMVDLGAQGFPDQIPLAISPGGTVAVPTGWYRLDDPGSFTPLADPPAEFYPPGNWPRFINDAGDQVHFLRAKSGGQRYLFRYHHEGTWQRLSPLGSGRTTFAPGGINTAEDVTATVRSMGVVAYGPDGVAQQLTDLVSPAYSGAEVTRAGSINDAGEILAHVIIGRDARLMRLVEADPCAASCTRVSDVTMVGEFVSDPQDPERCTPNASNHVVATVRVTDAAGKPLSGVRVTGHFLDDYWLDREVVGTTNAKGSVRFVHDGPACVGAVAFLVDGAAAKGRTFDRTTGILTDWVIPLP